MTPEVKNSLTASRDFSIKALIFLPMARRGLVAAPRGRAGPGYFREGVWGVWDDFISPKDGLVVV